MLFFQINRKSYFTIGKYYVKISVNKYYKGLLYARAHKCIF